MDNDFINISSIETHLDAVIRENVCPRCYAGTLPATLPQGAMDMVVIDCGNTIRDLNAYGRGTVSIYLYAQPTNGLKNVPALSRLEKAFGKAMRGGLFDNENYIVARETLLGGTGYNTTYNMHYNIKAIRIIIK